jgi:invasion protein IalB
MAAMIRSRISIFAALGAATWFVVACAVAPASAQGIERVGDFGDWSSFKFVEDGKPGCYMASQPKKAEGDYKKRGDIYTIVAHRPAENRRDEVSIVAGYSFKKDSWVEVVIGKQSYKLFTENDGAWAPDKDGDIALVTAMKKGTTMVVKGISLRGTATTDTYSLKGFTKAYNAISKACKAQ